MVSEYLVLELVAQAEFWVEMELAVVVVPMERMAAQEPQLPEWEAFTAVVVAVLIMHQT